MSTKPTIPTASEREALWAEHRKGKTCGECYLYGRDSPCKRARIPDGAGFQPQPGQDASECRRFAERLK